MPVKVALLYGYGGLPSHYNGMAVKGLELAHKKFGIEFDTALPHTFGDIQDALWSFARAKKYNLIISFGFAAGPALSRVASEFRSQKFAAIDARAEGPNILSYWSGHVDIGAYAGYLAGLISKSRVVGSVWGEDYPILRRWITGYATGVKLANPKADAFYSFLGSWEDESLAELHALKQYGSNADIVMAHADAANMGIVRAARKAGKFAIGFAADRKADREHVLFDVARHLEICVVDAVKQIVEGTFRGSVKANLGVKEGIYDIELEDSHPAVTDKVKAQACLFKEGLSAGRTRLPNTEEEIQLAFSLAKHTFV